MKKVMINKDDLMELAKVSIKMFLNVKEDSDIPQGLVYTATNDNCESLIKAVNVNESLCSIKQVDEDSYEFLYSEDFVKDLTKTYPERLDLIKEVTFLNNIIRKEETKMVVTVKDNDVKELLKVALELTFGIKIDEDKENSAEFEKNYDVKIAKENLVNKNIKFGSECKFSILDDAELIFEYNDEFIKNNIDIMSESQLEILKRVNFLKEIIESR